MRITHLGHACILLEHNGSRLLLDPGTYSSGLEGLTGLTAIAVTHQHPDHVDPERFAALTETNGDAELIVETETVEALGLGGRRLTRVEAGHTARVAEMEFRAVGGRHARNHDQVPPLGNVGYVVTANGTTFFHPGDSYDEAPGDIDVLGLPLNAPWCRMSETLSFLHAVSPRVVVPIHTGLLSEDGLAAYLMHVERFGPAGTEVVDLRPGSAYDV